MFTNILVWVGILTVLAYCAVCILLFLQQTRFIFFPSSIIETTPTFLNLPYEEVWIPIQIQSHQVEYIHGWWLGANQSNGKVLLYLHGNGINIGANITNASRFYQLGFSVLLIDYRGYGNSRGRFPNERRVCEDAAIAWNYLVHQRKIAPSQIFIYGHSLGGAIAIDLAIKQQDAAGLIVESSFTSIRQVVAYRNIFRIFPVGLILTQRFESIQKVPQLKMPILFIHGISDITIPAFMSEELYAAAPEPKRLLLVADGGHNNVAEVATAEYLQAVLWLAKQLEQEEDKTNKN
ncbi:MAG: alpha/beta hydrolase [Fischerella sp. CENA71]|nr:alpha/beta hydrolase [Fischerella sp. CENA71]